MVDPPGQGDQSNIHSNPTVQAQPARARMPWLEERPKFLCRFTPELGSYVEHSCHGGWGCLDTCPCPTAHSRSDKRCGCATNSCRCGDYRPGCKFGEYGDTPFAQCEKCYAEEQAIEAKNSGPSPGFAGRRPPREQPLGWVGAKLAGGKLGRGNFVARIALKVYSKCTLGTL